VPGDGFFSMWSDDARLAAERRAAREGVQHRHMMQPLRPAPGDAITVALETSSSEPVCAARCVYTTDDADAASDPDHGRAHVVDLTEVAVEWDGTLWQYVRRWEGVIPPQPAGTMLRYRIGARGMESGSWRWALGRSASEHPSPDHAIWIDDDTPPEWAKTALLYQVFVDRFSPSPGRRWKRPKALDGFYGGTIKGVTSRLEHIASLGCDVVWLSPVFASPTHHGYDATDLYTVEPRLGTNDDLKELIDAAHARGMRILLDLVPNHWSNEHPTFQHAQQHADSPYRDWYLWRDWPDGYETFWTVKAMPKLNLARHSPAREHLLEAAEHWLREGIDGYRVDHAQGPPPDLYADLRRRCRAVKPDCWLFGEVVEGADYQRGFAANLDGNLDFLLCWGLRRAFASGEWSVGELAGLLDVHDAYFPPGFTRPSCLDNHDMERFLYHAGGDVRALKAAALLLYTLPGPPVVYYGTEAGLSQRSPGGFEPSREPMPWSAKQDRDLLGYFQALGEARRNHGWHDATRRLAALDAGAGTLAYFLDTEAGTTLLAVNAGDGVRTLSVDASNLPADATVSVGDATLRRDGDVLSVRLGPRGSALIA
jgi:cyclomaltodextrinase / maltogenic alpha-amylase / neopullulanase